MIPLWRQVQKTNFTNAQELLDFLEIDEEFQSKVLPHSRFPLNLPRRLAEKIAKNTLEDPLLKQFLPLKEEEKIVSNYVLDPVEDFSFRKERKLLHKYQARALLLTTSACAMHCRYCFRQHFDYDTQDKLFEKEIALIAQDTSLSEILLSGGDPLSLSDSALKQLFNQLEDLSHVKRVRFHTRFPIGIPERVTDELLSLFAQTRLQVIFIIHSNHAKEWDDEIFGALKKIQCLGIPVLQQAVLLKGINDDLSALTDLYNLLINRGIIPYYLYQLDKVQGSAHFEVEEAKGKALMEALVRELPGYGVPKYVKEIAGMASKTCIE